MDVAVPGCRISEGQQYLGWSIESERQLGLAGQKSNVWKRYKDMEESYFVHKVQVLIETSECEIVNQRRSNKLQNQLQGFGKSLLVISKEVMEGEEKGKMAVVVGAGKMFAGQLGSKSHPETVKLIRSSILLWIELFLKKCRNESVENVCSNWREAEGDDKIARDLFEEHYVKRQDLLFVEIEESQIPAKAQDCFENIIGGSYVETSSLWLRTRKRCHSGIQEERARNLNRKKDGEKLISILARLKYTTLLRNDMIVGRLSVYNEEKWLESKETEMARAWESIDLWPFVSFDSEGHGIYYQVGLYGEAGWECMVFGPAFLPVEIMELLESERTIVTGKNIHKDLEWVLGKSVGWRAVDLGVWTRDLKFHGHEENGLKRMFQESVGFKKIKIDKNHPEDREKFGYIRMGNWARTQLDSRQLTYMSSDVTLPGTVVFDILITLVHEELGVAILDKQFKNIEEFVAPYVSRLIDRSINEKLQHPCHSIPIECRSISENTAALALSVEIHHAGDVIGESVEDRRKRFADHIIRFGREQLLNGKSCGGPVWSKPPELRGKRGKDLCEKFELNESWD